ncbi:MAG TPA: SDR family oxidoreductase [Bryobacteraceae bacterium]|nr:SDR family oxidoreductase [Bryobacteraceae bacterium]
MEPSIEAPFTLEGKAALVTGSGRGIGRAVAQKLAACGASVMLTDIDEAPVREAAADIGERAHWLVGDLTAPDFPQKVVDATIAAFGSLDIIVNNAGYVWDNVIQKMTDEQFQAMLNIHLVAPFRILRAASSFLREAAKRETAEGRRVMRKVVNITSISGVDGIAGQAGYGAGKSGINGLTKVLAKEWGRYNVNVNSVGFGLIDTRLIQPIDKNAPPTIEMAGRQIPVGAPPAFLEAAKAACPLGRLGTTEEAAGAVLFFCSPLSDYVSGEILIVSGGARG